MVVLTDISSDIREHLTVQPPATNFQQGPPPIAPSSNPEKNTLSEVEMNMSTPIDEVMDSPMGLMQPQMGMSQPQMVDGRALQEHPAAPAHNPVVTSTSKKNYPLNLNEDQVQALLAGAAGVLAFSRPVQERLASMVPRAFEMEGGLSTIGMVITALIAAIVFYLAKRAI
jgi:hypothetical protein